LTVANYPGNLIPLASNTNYPLTVNRFENLTNITLGYKTNLLPEIQSSQFNIPENPPLNTVLATVLATDPDEGQTLTYRFSSNPGPFSIDVLTGQIRYTAMRTPLPQPWSAHSLLRIPMQGSTAN